MTNTSDRPWRTVTGSIEMRVRLTPKGGKDAVDGLTVTSDGPAFKARVRAAPEDGEANDALVALVSNWLGLPKRDVALVAGHKSRTKLLRITTDPVVVEEKLLAAMAVPPLEKSA